jgi:tripeptide aminopeptidase
VSSAAFTSPLAAELGPELTERLVRYARIGTQSARDRTSCPSTEGQLELGRLLVGELRAAGLEDAELDENGYVMATLPAVGAESQLAPVGLIAHLDTSPDAPGHGVKPLVHRSYDGGVIELPRGATTLDPARMPELSGTLGHDLVTSSGDTLLGADDKAGVAIVMTAVAHLAAHPELPRPPIRVAFTPDEEIGEGATLFDIPRFGARCAYTLDGSSLGELQDESFSALEAIVSISGIDVHPGQAKGKLVNALRLIAKLVVALPDELSPERTAGREGFIHPYELTGSSGQAELRMILRDFDEDKLEGYAELVRRTAADVVESAPGAELAIDVRRQYRNMRAYLGGVPEVVAAAEAAMREEGVEPVRTPIRGGTDGSRLSEMGLPTPNIFTGGHEYHSVREWASVQEMAAAAATVVRLAGVWSRPEFAAGESAARSAG